MENPVITLKLNLLGDLVQQLNAIAREFPDDEVDAIDEEFDEILEVIRRLRIEILGDLDEYFNDIKANNEPVYLPYWTVRRELQETVF